MCGWRMMTIDEMVIEVCELYDKNELVYSYEDVQKMSEDQLKSEMVEYVEF